MHKRKPTAQDYKKAWTSPLVLTLLGYYFSMALVGLLTPDNILRDYLWTREFSDFMATIVPQIDRITALNIQPDVNRFYFSVLWGGSPLLFLIGIIGITIKRKQFHLVWSTPVSKMLLSMIGLALIVYFSQHLYGMTDVTNRQLKFFLGNTFGRSFWASVVYTHGPVIALLGLLSWLYGWASGKIPQRIRDAHKGNTNHD